MDQNNKNLKAKGKQPILITGLILGIIVFLYFNSSQSSSKIKEIEFEQILKKGHVKAVSLIINKNIVEITVKEKYLSDPFHKNRLSYGSDQNQLENGPHYSMKIPSAEVFNQNFREIQRSLPDEYKVGYETTERFDIFSLLLNWGGLVVTILIFWMFFRRMPGSSGGGIFNIGKSKARLFSSKDKEKITFKDVAGLKEAKEELVEIVDFLKSPRKFTKLGGKIPKGALLIGAPGTGKTLLAKAVAGEAEVPFFSLSGSDFVEMFVGIGSARVRDLFKQAKDKAPCIIFIDEIDAIGRSRSNGQLPGGNDERENTLNSLLVEMDGFSSNSGIIILAATNRPEILDQALLRPGRFDRQISIDIPSLREREEIFEVHLAPLKISNDIKAKKLAEQTPGFAGAEIANVCNEAALIAARNNKTSVEMKDFQDAIDRVIGGLEKRDKIISPDEKEIISYHEAGHAVAGWFLEHAHPLVKVTIVPRGHAALGYAQYLPTEKHITRYDEILDEICVSLGGRVAEELVFGKISTGALSDLEIVTKKAYGIVKIFGMNDKIGNISYYDSQKKSYSFVKPYSESTGMLIDEEVRNLVNMAYERTKKLLISKKQELEIIARELLLKEVIFQDDIQKLLGKRPFPKKSKENNTSTDADTPMSDI